MTTTGNRSRNASDRALTERALKGRDIASGEATAHAVAARVRKRRKATSPPVNSVVTRSGGSAAHRRSVPLIHGEASPL
ncbi:MAG: hypothetical protein K0Q92_2620 [Steroidobacteraceae bacterium]|nr:hypothetical protein [Steroidobacteraceae bacterium]